LFIGGIGGVIGDNGGGSVGTYGSTRAGRGGDGTVGRVMEGRKEAVGNMDAIQMLDSQAPDRAPPVDRNVISNTASDKNV
jgi:hypothetical protein